MRRRARDAAIRELRAHVHTEISSSNRNVENVQQCTQESIQQLERRIVDKISENRGNVDSQLGSLGGKFDALQNSMQTLSNEIFRSIGQLEGLMPGGRPKS